MGEVTAGRSARGTADGDGRLESRLRSALATSAIALHYQPIVELASGRVTGVEALARWTDAELGTVPPDRFVAVAEATGLILDLGMQVLERACREAPGLRPPTPGGDLLVSVNVSALQVVDPAFVPQVDRVLRSSGMTPANLCLEITETAAMDDVGVAVRRLTELRDLGLRLALDDFGTGYSSLTMLRRLPVDLVKMDRAFVAHLTTDAHDAVLARLIVDAAHSMGMRVCAEGVETVAQARQLAALGCDTAQGWHFAAALPPGDTLDRALSSQGGWPDDGGPDATTSGQAAPVLLGADELVLVTDPRGVVAFVSSSAVHLLGASPADVVGTHVLDHLRPAGDGTDVVGPDGGLRDGTARMRARTAGGDAGRWLEVRTSTVRRHDGRPHQSLSVARDVTAVVSAEEETAESERRFRHAFDDAPIGMAMTTLEGTFMRVNRAFAQMLGYGPEDVLRATVEELTVEEDRAADRVNLSQVGRGEELVHDVAKRYLHQDGHPVPVRVRAAVVTGPPDSPPYILAHVVGQEEAFATGPGGTRMNRDVLVNLGRGLAAHPDDGLVVLRALRDDHGAVVDLVHEWVNEAAERNAGRPLRGAGLLETYGSDATLFGMMTDLLGTGRWHRVEVEYDSDTQDPLLHRRAFEIFVGDGGEDRVVCQYRDVTALRRARTALEHQAGHDELTGVPNRRRLREHLDVVLAGLVPGGPSVLVMLADLDRFKQVNDTHGHNVGDRLLQHATVRMRRAMRSHDVVTRYGGDEFVIVCPGITDDDEAAALAGRLREAVAGRYHLDGVEVEVGVSVGVTLTDRPVPTAELLERADRALYAAKARSGRPGVRSAAHD